MKSHWLEIVAAAGALLFVQMRAHAGPVRAISGTDRVNLAGAGGSYTPSFSGDGRFIVFVSHAHNLVTNDGFSPYLNVFVRDLTTSNTILVSVNTNGFGGANADAYSPSISSNGQFVAFVSAASNLVPNDTNGAPDVFVRDLVSGVTTLVSTDSAGNAPAPTLDSGINGRTRYHLSGNPQISWDGSLVVFESLASLTTLPDQNFMSDIFVRDLRSNTTALVSINALGTASGNGNSKSPSISGNGRFVAFVSTSTDLVAGATNNLGDIYVRDLQNGTTAWASINVGPLFFDHYGCVNPTLNADGRFVVFSAANPDLSIVGLIHHDLQTGISTVLSIHATPISFLKITFTPCSGCSAVSYQDTICTAFSQISSDGRFVASESLTNVYLWEVQTGSNELISVSADGTGAANLRAHTPVMTSDAQRIAFLSAANNLVAGADNGISQVYLRDRPSQTTFLVSANLSGLPSASEIAVTLPALSPDGQFVAFECMAVDLVLDDLNGEDDVFVRDMNSALTSLVSQRDLSRPATTATGQAGTLFKSSSADGRKIAFLSLDSDFSSDDTNGVPDVFVQDLISGASNSAILGNTGLFTGPGYWRYSALETAMSADGSYIVVGGRQDCLGSLNGNYNCGIESLVRFDLQAGTSELVSIRLDGNAEQGSDCSSPAISSAGRFVAFQSGANDLVAGHSVALPNVYVRDMLSGTNLMVSFNPQGVGVGGGNALFSPDDRWVLFSSSATDLTTNATGGFANLFARDLQSNTTRMVSLGIDGVSPLGYLHGAAISADSRHVAFVSRTNSVAMCDLASGTSVVVCASCDNPSISGDGRLVGYETTNGSGLRQIFVTDLRTGASNLISRSLQGAGGGNGDSTSPLLSWDGRFVVFASKAGDLVVNDNNQASDIFVRDRLLGITVAVSSNLRGDGTGNGPSTKPVLAADGRTVVFQTFASDLVPGDYNYRRDVFVLRLGGPDTDGDGMDDDWEMAYFGTLARNGSGDFDNDGVTDLQEFQAGTDPTNGRSVLRAVTLTSIQSGAAKVIWNASPGKKYQVQFRDDLSGSSWQTLPGVTVANGTTASLSDNSAGPNHRFYRVLLAE